MIRKYRNRLNLAAMILGVGFLFCWVNLFIALPIILVSTLVMIKTMDTLEKLGDVKK